MHYNVCSRNVKVKKRSQRRDAKFAEKRFEDDSNSNLPDFADCGSCDKHG